MEKKLSPLEQHLLDQIKERIKSQDLTLERVGRQVKPDSKTPAQNAHQYLSGSRGVLTGYIDRLLQELGAEKITVVWRD